MGLNPRLLSEDVRPAARGLGGRCAGRQQVGPHRTVAARVAAVRRAARSTSHGPPVARGKRRQIFPPALQPSPICSQTPRPASPGPCTSAGEWIPAYEPTGGRCLLSAFRSSTPPLTEAWLACLSAAAACHISVVSRRPSSIRSGCYSRPSFTPGPRASAAPAGRERRRRAPRRDRPGAPASPSQLLCGPVACTN